MLKEGNWAGNSSRELIQIRWLLCPLPVSQRNVVVSLSCSYYGCTTSFAPSTEHCIISFEKCPTILHRTTALLSCQPSSVLGRQQVMGAGREIYKTQFTLNQTTSHYITGLTQMCFLILEIHQKCCVWKLLWCPGTFTIWKTNKGNCDL